jgi:hypothetical protein
MLLGSPARRFATFRWGAFADERRIMASDEAAESVTDERPRPWSRVVRRNVREAGTRTDSTRFDRPAHRHLPSPSVPARCGAFADAWRVLPETKVA